MSATDQELRCAIADLNDESKVLRAQRDRVIAYLRAASNYVDALGGISKTYRQIIVEIEDSK